MTTNKSDVSYEYINDLCSAIEKFTEKEEILNSNVFVYKSSNLKFAIQRALYSTYANNQNLFEIYDKWSVGTLPQKVYIRSDIEKKLAAGMTDISEERFEICDRNNVKKIGRFLIGNIFRIIFIDSIVSLARRHANYSFQKKIAAKILFYSPNERFVWYTKPIFDSLPVPCAYITHNFELANILKEKKIPFAPISKYGYFLEKLSQKNTLLKQYNLIEKYDLLHDSIKRINPDKVIIADGGGSECEVINQICKKENIACICIQQGWSPIIHNGFRNMSFSKMLVWGENFSNLLRPYNPKQHFIATGNHIINIPKNKMGTSVKTISFFFQTITRVLSAVGWEKFLQLTRIVAERYPRITVIIREHPAYPIKTEDKNKLEKCGNIIFMNPDKHDLNEVLNHSDLSVSIYSSVILESVATGVIPIIFNVTSYPHYFPDVGKDGAGIEIKKIDDALNAIDNLINNPKELEKFTIPMKNFRKQYFYANKEEAIKNIVNEIMN